MSEGAFACLNCGHAQFPPNKDSFDSWNCSYCFSGFISIKMLTNLAPKHFVLQIDGNADTIQGERPCPMCERHMEVVEAIYKEKAVEVDVCRFCRIVWFDSGEMVRALRYRSPENMVSDEDETMIVPPPGRPGAPAPEPELTEDTAPEPWHTYTIIILCLILMPMAIRKPEIVARFGFLRAEPFRMYGFTWITSLFIHDNVLQLMGNMAVLYLTGSYVEKVLGGERFFRLFLISGLAGRFVYLFSGGREDTICIGATGAICGIAACHLVTFPYMRALFPEEKYKSSSNAIAWLVVLAATGIGMYIAWNFLEVGIKQIADGSEHVTQAGTFYATLATYMAGASFHSHLASAIVGLLWSVGRSALKPGPKRQKPRSDHSTRLRG